MEIKSNKHSKEILAYISCNKGRITSSSTVWIPVTDIKLVNNIDSNRIIYASSIKEAKQLLCKTFHKEDNNIISTLEFYKEDIADHSSSLYSEFLSLLDSSLKDSDNITKILVKHETPEITGAISKDQAMYLIDKYKVIQLAKNYRTKEVFINNHIVSYKTSIHPDGFILENDYWHNKRILYDPKKGKNRYRAYKKSLTQKEDSTLNKYTIINILQIIVVISISKNERRWDIIKLPHNYTNIELKWSNLLHYSKTLLRFLRDSNKYNLIIHNKDKKSYTGFTLIEILNKINISEIYNSSFIKKKHRKEVLSIIYYIKRLVGASKNGTA